MHGVITSMPAVAYVLLALDSNNYVHFTVRDGVALYPGPLRRRRKGLVHTV